MNGRFILVSGSASRNCSSHVLARAMDFLLALVPEVLKLGGGFVLLAGDEQRTKGSDGLPRIFDWTILRAMEPFVENTLQPQRVLARVIMRDDSWQYRMGDGERGTFNRLQQRGALEVHRIPNEAYTGGKYREAQCEASDCMLALGGGKGTYSLGQQMIALGKPVLPLDLEIGSFSEDGGGALLLHKEFQAKPEVFFPVTYPRLSNKIEFLSLAGEGQDPASVAQRAIEALALELESIPSQGPSRNGGLGALLDSVTGYVQKIGGLVKALASLKNFLPWL